jgi:predicted PurR-regulated permease PerM
MPLDETPAGTERDSAGAAHGSWQQASQVATVGLFVIALAWMVYAAQHVIVPVLLAWAIATIVLPMVKLMQEHRVPRVVAALLVTFLFLALIGVLVLLLSAPLTYWLGRATYVGALLREKLESFTQPLALLEEVQKGLTAIGSGGSPPPRSASSSFLSAHSSSISSTGKNCATPLSSSFATARRALPPSRP